MSPEVHALLRMTHIVCGTGSFVLGGVVALLPKFGRLSVWHRRLGRLYAVCMLIMAALSIPLAWNRQNWLLFTIGVLTLVAVLHGWRTIRAARRLQGAEAGAPRLSLIETHITMMSSSYIAAWTAFFVANHPFGVNGVGILLAYWFGPSIIGVPILIRAKRHFRAKLQTPGAPDPTAPEGIGGAVS